MKKPRDLIAELHNWLDTQQQEITQRRGYRVDQRIDATTDPDRPHYVYHLLSPDGQPISQHRTSRAAWEAAFDHFIAAVRAKHDRAGGSNERGTSL